jgi:hypothetical protein
MVLVVAASAAGGCGDADRGLHDVEHAKAPPAPGCPLPQDGGELVWCQTFAGTSLANVTSVARHPAGGVVLAGYFRGTLQVGRAQLESPQIGGFVVRLDSGGEMRWARSFGELSAAAPQAVAVTSSGDVVLAATLAGSVDFGDGVMTSAGETDLALVVFDAEGNSRWSGVFGDAAAQVADAVAVDDQGAIVVAGHFFGSLDFGLGPLVHNAEDSPAVFVAKLDAAIDPVWNRTVPSTTSRPFGSPAASLAIASNGRALIGVADSRDFGVSAVDAAGVSLWSRAYGGIQFGSLAVAPDGDVVWSGARGDIFFDMRAVLARLDADGHSVWERELDPELLEDSSHAYAAGIAVDDDGAIFVRAGGGYPGDADSTGLLARLSPWGFSTWRETIVRPAIWGAHLAPDGAGGFYLAGNTVTEFFQDIFDYPLGGHWAFIAHYELPPLPEHPLRHDWSPSSHPSRQQ